ncbi:hypothetical protein JG687_00005264 [Phytophthora cactorum]|uniref:Uncharacterized protein n=1 Tax=Phytophthora cactorum TaxID=29920 RepID=A0A8T1UR32_9STRA|nr:hypothetical protein JG687_00005264 [Phytophthora cactorum]
MYKSHFSAGNAGQVRCHPQRSDFASAQASPTASMGKNVRVISSQRCHKALPALAERGAVKIHLPPRSSLCSAALHRRQAHQLGDQDGGPPATAPTSACKTSLTIATSCETITAPSKTYLFKSIL